MRARSFGKRSEPRSSKAGGWAAWCRATGDAARKHALDGLALAGAADARSADLRACLEESVVFRKDGVYAAPIHLPLLVFGAERQEIGARGHLGSTLSTLLWAGAELMDKVEDGQLSPRWIGREHAARYAAMTVGCALPPALIAEREERAAVRRALTALFARTLLRMFDGQLTDLTHTDANYVARESVERSVVGKNGEAKAFFAAVGACVAGAEAAQVDRWARFGRALGVVFQLQSDHYDLFFRADARDLMQGTRTLHVAIALEIMDGAEREALVKLLDAARVDASARIRVRELLRQARFVVPWSRRVKHWATETIDALDACSPAEPYGSWLKNLVASRAPAC